MKSLLLSSYSLNESHRSPYAADRAANAIRSDGERNLIGRRTQSDQTAFGTHR